MITTTGRIIACKNMALGKCPVSAVAIGTGGTDPTYGVPIAPSVNDTELKAKIYFSQVIDVVDVQIPPVYDTPRIVIRHTFYSSAVKPTGTAIAAINEFGLYAKDPDSGLYVLFARQTFENSVFRVPASGESISRDAVTLSYPFSVI